MKKLLGPCFSKKRVLSTPPTLEPEKPVVAVEMQNFPVNPRADNDALIQETSTDTLQKAKHRRWPHSLKL